MTSSSRSRVPGQASEEAVEAAAAVYNFGVFPGDESEASPVEVEQMTLTVLEAAHSPALGLDRSVCLRDVVEVLRENARQSVTKEAEYFNSKLADKIERTFSARSSSSPEGGSSE